MSLKNPIYKDVDHYISQMPEVARERLETIRRIVAEEAPEVQEAIKYDMPTFVLNGNMLSCAAFAKHLSIFPYTDAMLGKIEGLEAHVAGRGTAQFNYDEPLPVNLIREMIRMRVAEYRAKP